MLKLTLTKNDKVLMGDDVVFEVISLSQDKVTIAFNAPKEMKITAVFKELRNQFKRRQSSSDVTTP